MSISVDQKSKAVQEMAREWPMTEALMGGTAAMRAAGQTFLPKWPAEEAEAYKTRLSVATLYPAYSRTVRVMAGKPFAKQVTLSEDTPQQLIDWCADIDRQGTSLHVFAAEMFEEAVAHGIAGILVDTPRAPDTGGRPATQADQQRAGMRPYFVRVKHGQILGWRAQLTRGGLVLTQLRILESIEEPDGDFGATDVQQVRVLEPGKWATYRKGKSDWEVHDTGTTGLDFIPYVPLYGTRMAFMVGKAPLIDLAYQNVEHYQSKSDQQTILHVARVPILTCSGGDDKTDIVVGGAHAVRLPAGAELKYTEHSGASIGVGRQSLIDLEERMIATGGELLVAKPGKRTAEESANDAEANKSDLQRIAEVFEDSLDLALSYMARLGGQNDRAKVSLFKDYAARSLSEASAQLVLALQQSGVIRKETLIKEQQRRGILSPDVDPREEPALAAEEVTPAEGDDDPPPGD